MEGRAPLTADELVDRLRLFSPGIVGDLYQIAMHGLATEEQRESRIDAKAHVLLLASAVLLGVALASGAVLRTEDLLATRASLAAYIAVLCAGFCACASALWVLFVSGEYRGTDEREVLDADELAAADKEFLDAQKEEKEERGNVRAKGAIGDRPLVAALAAALRGTRGEGEATPCRAIRVLLILVPADAVRRRGWRRRSALCLKGST